MNKSNFLVKFLYNAIKTINIQLEKNLNKLNFNNLRKLSINSKLILTFVAVIVFFISYLLLPTFYKQNDLSVKFNKELFEKLNLDFKIKQDLKYSFFPRPHFIIKDTVIIDNLKEISKIDKLKVYISFKNLFSLQKIEIKDIYIENANFNFDKNNYNFFVKLLDNNFISGGVKIRNSNVFFRDEEKEVLFINKILNMKYYHDKKELKNITYSKNQIFNIPYSIKIYKQDNKIFSKLNLSFLKLKIENVLDYKKEIKKGKANLNLNKFKSFIDYNVYKNSFDFNFFNKSENSEFSYNGNFNLNPFYSNVEGLAKRLNLSYFFNSNSIISQLFKAEIFNKKNIEFKLNIIAKNLSNNSNINDIVLKSKIEDGLIDFDGTKFKWKKFADFNIEDSLIYVKESELFLDAKLKINVQDYNEVYKFLLTPKNYRNKIDQIDLNFTYNFDQKIAALNDIKIDNKINENINKILSNVILKKHDLQNKIYFKNLLNEAIKSYAG